MTSIVSRVRKWRSNAVSPSYDWWYTTQPVKLSLTDYPHGVKPVENKNPLSRQVGGDHYKNLKIQPIDYIMANGLGFCEGNIVKYITRYSQKNGVEDIDKVIHYAEILKASLLKENPA
jgi:hypothetical protein